MVRSRLPTYLSGFPTLFLLALLLFRWMLSRPDMTLLLSSSTTHTTDITSKTHTAYLDNHPPTYSPTGVDDKERKRR